MKKATSKDVAKLAEVSQSTVSLVLNNSKKISFSPSTRERVFAAAQELGYKLPLRMNPEKRAINRLLMVFTPTLANQYYTELTQAIEEYADECGYRVIFCNTFRKSELERYYLELSMQIHADGIIYTFLPSFPSMLEQISATTPVVLIGEKRDGLSVSSVELSNVRAGSLVIEHLISLGHRRFAFLSTPINNFTLAREQRLVGIRNVLREHQLEQNLTVIFRDTADENDLSKSPYEYYTGYELAKSLLEQGTDVTAFIGVNDITALGIMAAIREKKYSVPKDFSVCGFDNIFSTQFSVPSLTTVDHHLGIRGKSAVDMIITKIEADSDALNGPIVNKIEYEPQLIVRDSTGKVD